MAQCKHCFEDLPKGTKKSEHRCDMVKLDNGHTVRRSRTLLGGDLYEQISDGQLKVMERHVPEPVRPIGSMFGKEVKRGPGGAVLLGEDQ